MKKNGLKASAFLLALLSVYNLNLQAQVGTIEKQAESISAGELKSHIYFLASDFMAGRVGPSPEYRIAAQYVASQFRSAGLTPAVITEDGDAVYLQEVPFSKTRYGNKIEWSIKRGDKEIGLRHNIDFKILLSSSLSYNDMEVVYVGYGIDEPDFKWNDFEGLDTEGKILLCIGGAPLKKGKPVLPEEIHKKYSGPRGAQSKIMSFFNRGAAAIIIADVDGSTGWPFEMIPSQLKDEKYVYKGDVEGESSEMIPSIYLARPEIFNHFMEGSRYNPLNDTDNILKHYKPQVLEDIRFSGETEVISREDITTPNVIAMVRGTDPVLKDEYIVVGAHLDHVKPFNGQVCNGADDNASGSAAVIEIAEALAMNPCRRSVVFVTYTAEEMGLHGSDYFVNKGPFPLDKIKFNLNMDMIGRSGKGNEESRAHYVVTDKKYLEGLKIFISDINNGITDFPIIFDNDDDSPGGSDHMSFIKNDIPAFFFFSGIHADLHQPGDDPEKIDYPKAESIARLAFMITEKLANMDQVPDFLSEED